MTYDELVELVESTHGKPIAIYLDNFCKKADGSDFPITFEITVRDFSNLVTTVKDFADANLLGELEYYVVETDTNLFIRTTPTITH